MTEPPPSMRERHKAATRHALSWAALSLAKERGLENVRVADIAEVAGVSLRTFNNYFSSKEEAIVAIGADRAASTVAALRSRPADEDLWTALIHAVGAQFADEPDRGWIAGARLVTGSAAIRAEYLRSGAAHADVLAAALADRIGVVADRDLFPQLLARAVVTAEQVAIDHWLDNPDGEPLVSVVHRVLDHLRSGLQPPRPTTPEATR